jgi:hypothetical protein
MYTKIVRFLVKMERQMSGHCDGSGSGGGTGHCY